MNIKRLKSQELIVLCMIDHLFQILKLSLVLCLIVLFFYFFMNISLLN